MKQHASNSGFLLIELLVVLGIIALLIGLSISGLRFVQQQQTRFQLQQLYLECLYKQRVAMVTNAIIELPINTSTVSARLGFLPGAKGPPCAPTEIIKQPITFKGNKIVFHPDGIISAGSVYVVDATGSYMYALTSGVTPVSYLRMYRYENGTWVGIVT